MTTTMEDAVRVGGRSRASAAVPAVMRAIVQDAYGGTDVFRHEEIAVPRAGDGEVLLRVHSAGMDRGTWHLMTGTPYLMRVMGFGFRGPKSRVPGLDVAGTVVAVGNGVTRFAVGDEVFGIAAGSYAEYARAREDKLARKPARVGLAEAAVVGVSGLTALEALRVARLERGQRVLIVGASGGVGTYAVQIAKARGAEVTGVCSTAKVDFVRALGADHVVDYTTTDFTTGAPHDVILDIGGNTPIRRLRRVLGPTGTIVLVGGEGHGNWTGGLLTRSLPAVLLSTFSRQRVAMCMSREHFAGLEELAALIDASQLRPVVDRSYALADVRAAMHDLESGRARGKLAVRVTG